MTQITLNLRAESFDLDRLGQALQILRQHGFTCDRLEVAGMAQEPSKPAEPPQTPPPAQTLANGWPGRMLMPFPLFLAWLHRQDIFVGFKPDGRLRIMDADKNMDEFIRRHIDAYMEKLREHAQMKVDRTEGHHWFRRTAALLNCIPDESQRCRLRDRFERTVERYTRNFPAKPHFCAYWGYDAVVHSLWPKPRQLLPITQKA